MFREDLYDAKLEVKGTDGKTVTFQMDKMSGAGATSKATKYRPSNGLENELDLGGPKSVENVTLTRLYETLLDEQIHWLIAQAGRAAVAVHKQPLDDNGHAFGHPLNYTGKLQDVKPPPTDSESEKPALCELMCSLESSVG